MADNELDKLRQSCLTKLHLCTDNVLKYLENDKEEELTRLRSYVENYCLHEAYPDMIEQTAEKIKVELNASNIDRIEKKFNNCLNNMVGTMNVKSHPWMVELDNRIKRRNGVTENLNESDLEIINTNEAFVDPLTMRPFQDPVRNKYCGHSYERDSILKLIHFRKKQTLCPVVGCANKEPILQEHLMSDYDTRNRIIQQSNKEMLHNVDLDSE